jgi:hypothetical protein
MFFLPSLFKAPWLKNDSKFIIQSILLTGGVDFNWFVLLFVQLTIISPLLLVVSKNRVLSIFLLVIFYAISLLSFFNRPSYQSFRWTMIFGWSFVYLLGIIIAKYQPKGQFSLKNYGRLMLLFGSTFVILYTLFFNTKELVLTQHKYPPDIIYLSYGLIINFFLIIFAKKFILKILNPIIVFLSRNSYAIFFVHYLVLDYTFNFFTKTPLSKSIFTHLIFAIFFTLLITFSLNYFLHNLRNKSFLKSIIIIVTLTLIIYISKYFADQQTIANKAILEWIQKPSAVRVNEKYNRTYFSWINHQGKIQIRYFDHQSNRLSSTVTVDDLYQDFKIEAIDDHNPPSILALPDKSFLLFYAVHDVNNAFFAKKSTASESIERWSSRISLYENGQKTKYNYIQPFLMQNNEIIVFYRTGVFYHSKIAYKQSSDNGKTWSKERVLVDFGDVGLYPFVFVRNNNIYLAWNLSLYDNSKHNLYYTYSNDGGKNWYSPNDIPVNLPISNEDEMIIKDTGNTPAFILDISLDQNNQLMIVYGYENDPNHQIRIIRKKDTGWEDKLITKTKLLYNGKHFFPPGAVVNPDNPDQVLLSKKRAKLEIELWEYNRQTKQWHWKTNITSGSYFDNFRPEFVQNFDPKLPFVWNQGIYEGLQNDQWTGFDRVDLIFYKL